MIKFIPLFSILLLLAIGMTACSGTTSTAMEVEDSDLISHPEDWSEDTHGNDTEPNYAVVFPEDEVNQIKIIIAPEDWEAMQANMTELFGESGTGEGNGDAPGGGQPPMGNRPPPGDGALPEDFQPPEGAPNGAPLDGFNPPANGERPQGPEGALDGARPDEGGIRGGDMTPENPIWVSATIEFEDNTWTNVGVRYKGNSSLTSGWRSGTLKLPLKLDFDEFEDEYPEIKNQRFYGFKQLSLANGFSDESFLRDAATSLILEEAGLPVAKTAFYEVILDYGEGPVTLGLYTMIEVVDDTVVKSYFGSDDGNIYEAEGSAASFAASTYDQIEASFQKENNDVSDWSDIQALFDVLHSDQRITDPETWRDKLESLFDVNGFLEWLAISAVIQHWDAYGNMSHNYYLYDNPDTGQLTWISWDHNMAMSAGMGGGGNRGGGDKNVSLDKAEVSDNWPLIRYLLDDPAYYNIYLGYLAETVEGSFNPDNMAETYQTLADLIAPYAIADVGEDAFDVAVQQLIEHAYQRANDVDEFLSSVEY